MKPQLLALLLTLSVCFSHAHEERVNPDQRRAIKVRLQSTGCFEDLATRGAGTATRGATRGLSREPLAVGELPPAAAYFNDYFSMVIAAEFDLPYGRNTTLPAHYFFRWEGAEGEAKMKVQRELGIIWPGSSAPKTASTWMDMARHYRAGLAARGVDPRTTFVPAMVLYRDIDAKTRDYVFIDPLTESFPEDMSQWKVLTKDDGFNLPFKAIYGAMQQGKFPLLDAVHDVSHLVAFLRFPEFAQAVLAQIRLVPADKVTSGFKGREYWLTEALSVLDPQSLAANHKFLREQKRGTDVVAVADIEKELGALADDVLVDYAVAAAKHANAQLRDISGGNSNAPEKWYYLAESFGMKPEALAKVVMIADGKPAEVALGLAKVYFEKGPITLDANPKALTNETATFNYNTFFTAQLIIAMSLKTNKLTGDRAEALKQLVKFAARTEWELRHQPFTYQHWAQAFLVPSLPADSETGTRLFQVFGNPLVSLYYLGEGSKRPKK